MGRALFLAALLAAALGGASGEMPPRVKFVLRNLCGRPIELYWIMPTPDKHGERGMILQGPEVKNSSAMPIDSFVGHEFVVRPTDSPKPLAGRGGEIVWEGLHVVPEAHFVMSETNDLVNLLPSLELERWDARHRAMREVIKAVDACAATIAADGADDGADAAVTADERTCVMREECLALKLGEWLDTFHYELKIEGKLLREMWADMTKYGGAPEDSEAEEPTAELEMPVDENADDAARAALAYCKDLADEASPPHALSDGHGERWWRWWFGRRDDAAHERMRAYVDCIARRTESHIGAMMKAISDEQNAKQTFSEALRNSTCDDDAAVTSPALHTEIWRGTDGHPVTVMTLLNESVPPARVILLDNFITEEERVEMVARARPRLTSATVNQDGDNQALSSYRRSQAANVVADMRKEDDPITRVSARAFEVTNALGGYDLNHFGQEPFSVIQYKDPATLIAEGVCTGDGTCPGQEYRPHCDGACDGSPIMFGGRVATMLIYCETADVGGGTSFTKAGVHVVPKAGQAVLFTYRGTDGTTDTGLTEHSGCPIKEGEKWVATQWMREGVNPKESWVLFDPQGGRL